MNGGIGELQADQIKHLLDIVSRISRAHEEAKKLYLDRFAPDFNVFTLLGPNELRLSRILAWFLDPRETHGQGSRFLRIFLEALGQNTAGGDWDDAEVCREFPIPGGAGDVLVKTRNFQLAIENKPRAGDPDRQLMRYFEYLDGTGVPERHVVYLTRQGAPPPEHSISGNDRESRIKKSQLHLWSYTKEVLSWLCKSRAECRADRVSTFIDEFARYIQAEFAGVKDRTMADHLLDEIVSSIDKVEAVMNVISLADALRDRLISNLCDQLRSKLNIQEINPHLVSGEKYTGFTIDYSKSSPYQFCLEFQYTNFNGLVFGVYRKIKGSQGGDEYSFLNNRFGAGISDDDWWLWKRSASPSDPLLPAPQNWSGSNDPWIEIANGSLASKVEEAFRRTHEVLNECGVG